ncbi:isochorismatase family cysteine hydrolase [Acuticoccus sp. MNP-M23]|uniref:cysteine hydrolase family protein n=1 Tax=Acuticoccus sp. MNP-M23 TaxID=3072793 RepID=UPI00281551EB|nr:isochorismatase family cysteine hydrolase [Acuticoccus sp. MNP-M23]WMS44639.1 isochorismatase family cysteine hydrolase [Acuticoccus sp. MNP-M23]
MTARMMGTGPSQAWQVSASEVDMTRPALPVRPLRLDAAPRNIVLDANKTALVIVDMQNDFCTAGGYMDSRGIDVTPNRAPIAPLQRLVPAARAAAIPVIWVNWGVRKDLLNIAPSVRFAHNPDGEGSDIASPIPGTRSEILALGSWGAEVVDELNAKGGDIQVTKHRFSGFWDTDLDAILRNLGVKSLLIGGVNLDQCVMTTLEDASFLGYDVVLVEDGAATTSPACCTEAALYNIKLLFGFVTRADAIVEGLGA